MTRRLGRGGPWRHEDRGPTAAGPAASAPGARATEAGTPPVDQSPAPEARAADPQPWVRHRIRTPSEAGAAMAELRLARAGSDAGVLLTHEQAADGSWHVTVTDRSSPDLAQLPVVAAWLEAIANDIGGSYVGWEPVEGAFPTPAA